MEYWNPVDRELIDESLGQKDGIAYFEKYQKQLDFTFRKRFKTTYRALQLLNKITTKPATIVEVGTLRDANKGGGHSTYKFAEYCSRFGGVVHTVDILQEAIDFSIKATESYLPWIEYHVSDSTEFLRGFSGTIDLLYLDGLDATPGMEAQASKKQLEELEASMDKLSKNVVVLLDDADLPEGGKTKLSSEALLSSGFELVESAYQKVFFR